MGSGIAQVAATAGHDVLLYDHRTEALARSTDQLKKVLARLTEKGRIDPPTATAIEGRHAWSDDLRAMSDCALVIEAIVEDLDIKKETFRALEALVPQDTLLASNTSSLSITALAGGCRHPQRFLGLHFFNPAPLMPLVEIIPAVQTDPALVRHMDELMRAWGKWPVTAKDTPGFIVNRIARPYYSESLRMLEEGIADIEAIDRAMKHCGFRMGPFELMDFIGHDVNLAVTESVWKACFYEPRYQPSFTQRNLVYAGWLGRKTGRGFYSYDEANPATAQPAASSTNPELLAHRVLVMLINEAAEALYYGIAGRDDIDAAMTKGVNYPKGLLKWADEIGIAHCVQQLDALWDQYHDTRYRCSPLLRKMAAENSLFYN
jgi:3-hydroxybutyryl-CoA dehydrogenase